MEQVIIQPFAEWVASRQSEPLNEGDASDENGSKIDDVNHTDINDLDNADDLERLSLQALEREDAFLMGLHGHDDEDFDLPDANANVDHDLPGLDRERPVRFYMQLLISNIILIIIFQACRQF